MNEAPQFLVEWPSPWREFTSAIQPAMRRSPPKLGGEAQAGLFPIRGILLAMAVEVAVLVTAMVLPSTRMLPVTAERSRMTHDVIYFSADELPRTADLAGADSGKAGKRGGGSLRTPRQVIRVARDQVIRDTVMDAPQLQLPKSESLPANLLAYKTDAGPAPAESLKLKREAPRAQLAVPPPAEIPRSEMRRTQLANSAVAPPPVDLPQRELSRRSLAVATAVVPPPVSAPEQITSARARLSLPAEVVVAPRPEIGGAARARRQTNEFTTSVVAPPVEVSAAHSSSRVSGLGGGLVVVPPPVSPSEVRQRAAPSLGSAPVTPPPVELGSVHPTRSLQAANIAVAPPPMPAASSSSKPAADSTAKPNANPSTSGIVLSPTPGNKPTRPATTEKATVAMAPSPAGALGAGGTGGGGGLSRGTGPGTSPSGTNSGAAAAGGGKATTGNNPNGSSPYPGPGGTGMLSKGSPRVPGVSVSGGSNVVTLPSFGAPPEPHAGRSTVKGGSNAITIVASPRSGGAMNMYGAMKGDRVYTIYISTSIGQASMQFADPDSAAHPSANELVAPTPIRLDLPNDLAHGKMVVRYVLDRNGALRNPQVINSEGGDFEPKLLAALSNWKFSPALRGSEPIEVNVILGFGVSTN